MDKVNQAYATSHDKSANRSHAGVAETARQFTKKKPLAPKDVVIDQADGACTDANPGERS